MTDWAKLKVVDLKAELKRRNLPQHGLKAELVARLDESEETAVADGERPASGHDEAEAAPPVQEHSAIPAASPAAQEEKSKQDEQTATAPEVAFSLPTETNFSVESPSHAVDATEAVTQAQPTQTEEPLSENLTAPVSIDDQTASEDRESQKRKRKSATPSPSEEEIAAKRPRAASEHDEENTPQENAHPAPADPIPEAEVEQTPAAATLNSNDTNEASPPPRATEAVETNIAPVSSPLDATDDIDMDRDVVPALHPATTALYISNLMRPLRASDMQAHVRELAAPRSAHNEPDGDKVIVQFYMDQIRTHAFVVLASVQAASRIRSLLHDRVWPNESNRKPLAVDFVPPEKVADWIDMEENSGGGGRAGGGRGGGGGRSTSRWEVVYEKGADGLVEACLQQATGGPPSARPGAQNHAGTIDSDIAFAPLGPRGGGGSGSGRDNGFGPRGPRAADSGGAFPRQQQQHQQQQQHASHDSDYHDMQRTRARPSISYQPVSQELARRRIDNMQSYYTTDTRREWGRDFNRYSFELGDGFVDRGKEVFEGIRPPHRERERERDRFGGGKFGGRGGGGGGEGGGGGRRRKRGQFRPRSDRYLPGFAGNSGGREGGSGGGGGGRRWADDDRGDGRY